MKPDKSLITGALDIFIASNEETIEGAITYWQEILIHGDPEGLRSFAKLLTSIADQDQENNTALPIGARAHIHLRPVFDISKSSVEVIVGRLDAKGTAAFYDRNIAKYQ